LVSYATHNIDHAIKPQQTRVCATLTLWLLLFLVKARVPEEAKNAQALFQSDTYINTTDLFGSKVLHSYSDLRMATLTRVA
jgi:hypothetical protein